MAARGAAETSGRNAARRALYEALEVSPGATTEEIRRAFRRLARTHHPDRNQGDAAAEERFKRIVHAHDVLVDPRQRALYDEFGEEGLRRGFDAMRARARRQTTGGARPRGSATAKAPPPKKARGPLEGFLEGLFGRGAEPERGRDIEVLVAIEFLESLRGTERTLSVRRPERCATCSGAGEVEGEPCSVCRGSRVVETGFRIQAKIPAGVRTGSRVRLEGQGGAGKDGGPSGDLWMTLQVGSHPLFGRSGDDITIDVPITVADAVRGTRIHLPTPDGEVALRIPPGSQSGRRLRLRGKGAPSLESGTRGDLLARIMIHVPESGDGLADLADSLEPLYADSFRRRFES
jgi:molecular chaperone DnaJ